MQSCNIPKWSHNDIVFPLGQLSCTEAAISLLLLEIVQAPQPTFLPLVSTLNSNLQESLQKPLNT